MQRRRCERTGASRAGDRHERDEIVERGFGRVQILAKLGTRPTRLALLGNPFAGIESGRAEGRRAGQDPTP